MSAIATAVEIGDFHRFIERRIAWRPGMRELLEPIIKKNPEIITDETIRRFNDFLDFVEEFDPPRGKRQPVVTEGQVDWWLKKLGLNRYQKSFQPCITKAIQRLGYDVETLQGLNRRAIRLLIRALASLRQDYGICH